VTGVKVEKGDGLQRFRQAYGVNAQRPGEAPPAKEQNKAASTIDTGLQRERVSISPLGQELQKVKSAVAADPGIREEKVAALRKLIASGQYDVSDEQLAEKIVQHFLDEA
jgi:flagellar biosynthesis anti-sigma factor FlgM